MEFLFIASIKKKKKVKKSSFFILLALQYFPLLQEGSKRSTRVFLNKEGQFMQKWR